MGSPLHRLTPRLNEIFNSSREFAQRLTEAGGQGIGNAKGIAEGTDALRPIRRVDPWLVSDDMGRWAYGVALADLVLKGEPELGGR